MEKWLTVLAEFFAALMKAWLGEKSRDNANKEAGAAAARQSGAEDALERAKHVQETRDDISSLSDDALAERMRRNRESKRGSSNTGGDR